MNAKARKILQYIFAFLFVACVMLGVALNRKEEKNVQAMASEVTFESEWKDSYMIDSVFTVPSATLKTESGTEEVKQSYVVFPDGVAYATEKYILSQAGTYTVYFIGDSAVATKQFVVCSQAVSLLGGGRYEYLEQLKMTDSPIGGISVTLTDSSSLTFNSPIDVSNSDLTTPIATVYPYNFTKRLGQDGTNYETHIIVIRMTDAYNTSNYVDIEISYDPSGNDKNADGVYDKDEISYELFYRAGGSQDRIVGLHASVSASQWYKSINYEGTQYQVRHKTDTEGAWGPYGVKGGGSVNADNNPISVFYESATNKIYALDKDKLSFVTDLDSQIIYDSPFAGFTTGEVYVSILGDWFKTSQATVEISSIYGMEGEDLCVLNAVDTILPRITLPIYNEDVGEIVVAQGEEVQVFPYSAQDSSGIKESFVEVYYNYNSDQKISIGLKGNTFRPEKIGLYTVVYGAYDNYGNYNQQIFEVNCVKCVDNESLRLTFENGDFTLDSTKTVELSAGKKYALPTPVISNSNNLPTSLKITGVYENDFLNTLGKNVSVEEDNTVLFTDIGQYTLVYEYEDVFQSKRKEFTVKTVVSDEVVLEPNPILPEYFIKDSVCSLEPVQVRCFNTEETSLAEPLVYASFDGKDYIEIDARNLQVNANSTVRFKYVYQGATLYESAQIPIIDVNYNKALKIENYFVGDFSKKADGKKISFVSNAKTGNNELKFINPISFSNFYFSFEVLSQYNQFASFTVKLTDFYNAENSVSIEYGKEGEGSYFKIYTNESSTRISINNNFESLNSISYNASNYNFVTYSGAMIAFRNPFEKDKVLLSVSLNDMEGDSGLAISKINNQVIANRTSDTFAANFTMVDIQGTRTLGANVTVFRPFINDVLTPYIQGNFSMSIKGPNNQFCRDINGVEIRNLNVDETTISLTQYGTYMITYAYEDGWGNSDVRVVELIITDNVAPTLSLKGISKNGQVVQGKLGQKISLPTYTVSDNYSDAKNLKVVAFIVYPDFSSVLLTEDFSLVLGRVGEYRITYTCYDEAGNATKVEYRINVTKDGKK